MTTQSLHLIIAAGIGLFAMAVLAILLLYIRALRWKNIAKGYHEHMLHICELAGYKDMAKKQITRFREDFEETNHSAN